jgi:hypothetical protein
MKNIELENKLIIGTKIKFGKKYADFVGLSDIADTIVELIEGSFEYDNELYIEMQYAPSIWNKEDKDFESIYHLFGNDLEDFLDCEIVL